MNKYKLSIGRMIMSRISSFVLLHMVVLLLRNKVSSFIMTPATTLGRSLCSRQQVPASVFGRNNNDVSLKLSDHSCVLFAGSSIQLRNNPLLYMTIEDDDEQSATKTSFGERIKQLGFVQVIAKYIAIDLNKADDGQPKLTTKERLAKMGIAAALSYGWVSNVSYAICVSLAWYIFSKRTGVSPLAPGQWKGFLAVYFGFFVFNNVVRPARIAFSIGISPMFDKLIIKLQEKFNFNKATAITATVLLANVVGTISLMSAGIAIASIISGVPIFPAKI